MSLGLAGFLVTAHCTGGSVAFLRQFLLPELTNCEVQVSPEWVDGIYTIIYTKYQQEHVGEHADEEHSLHFCDVHWGPRVWTRKCPRVESAKLV